MADFKMAFEKMIKNEGGYVLHKVKGDSGGLTYAGIARTYHPQWEGWQTIDSGKLQSEELVLQVKEFYRRHFWKSVQGEKIESQFIAELMFDFAVNAGVGTAAKLAQMTLGLTADGIIGSQTIEAINQVEIENFSLKYSLAKIGRYSKIVSRDRSQEKFLLGWINRTLGELS